MATLEEIVIKLTAETSQLRAEMVGAAAMVKNNTDKMDSAIANFSKSGSQGISVFQTSVATMAGQLGAQAIMGAFNLLKDGVAALTQNLIEGGKEAIADEKSFNLLARSLQISGNYSLEAADSLMNYAEELEGVLGISGAVISQNMALASSLTSLDSNGIKRIVESAADMSVALGKDFVTMTEAVTKAVSGNAMGLQKLGIHLDLTADKSKNLEIVTAALNEKFGGAAIAQVNTFGGALVMLNKQYGDMFKEVAKTITQNQVVVAVMNEVSKMFQSVTVYIQKNASMLRDTLGQAIVTIIGYVQDMMIGLKLFFQLFDVGFKAASLPIKILIDDIQLLKSALTLDWDGVKTNAKDLVTNFTDIGAAVGRFGEENSMDVVIDGLGKVQSGAAAAFDQMVMSGEDGASTINNVNDSLGKTSEKVTEAKSAIDSWAESLAAAGGNTLKNEEELEDTTLKDKLDLELITQQEYFDALAIMKEEQHLAELEQLDAATVDDATRMAAELELERLHMAEMTKISVDAQKLKNEEKKKLEEKAKKDKEKSESDTWAAVGVLAAAGSKEMQMISKGRAIYQATVDGYAAVQNALASGGPFPMNIASAAIIGAATAANVAKIAGVQGFAKGTDSVPFSAGGGNLGDNFPAMLKAGERVVPTETNQDLKAFLDNQKSQSNVSINVTVMPNTGLNNEQVGNLIEQLNNYFTSGGLKLIGAT